MSEFYVDLVQGRELRASDNSYDSDCHCYNRCECVCYCECECYECYCADGGCY